MAGNSDIEKDTRQWFVRMESGGAVYGPVRTQGLQLWTEQGRVLPDDEVSEDKIHWRPAQELPELGMDMLIAHPNGTFIGPFHRNALQVLIQEGKIPPDAEPFPKSELAERLAARQMMLFGDDAQEESRAAGGSKRRKGGKSAAAREDAEDREDLRPQLAELHDLLDAQKSECANLQARWEESEEARRTAEAARDEAEGRAEELETAKTAAEETAKAAEAAQAAAESARDEAVTRAEALEAAKTAAEETAKAAEVAQAAAEFARDEAVSRAEALVAAKTAAEEAAKSAEAAQAAAESARDEAVSCAEALEAAKIAAEEDAKAAETARVAAVSRAEALEAEVAKFKAHEQETEDGTASLRWKLMTAESERDELQNELSRRKTECETLQARLEKDAALAAEELRTREEALAAQTTRNEELFAQLQEKSRRCDAAWKKVAAMDEDFAAERDRMESKIAQAKAEAAEEAGRELAELLSFSNQRDADYARELADLRAQVAELRAQLETQSAESNGNPT